MKSYPLAKIKKQETREIDIFYQHLRDKHREKLQKTVSGVPHLRTS